MDRRFTVYQRVSTEKPADDVFNAVVHSMQLTVGGQVTRNGNVVTVVNGTQNLNFAFMSELRADIVLTQPTPGVVDINGTIVSTPSTFFWICLIVGFFCLWFLWLFLILFYTCDPRTNYQTAVDRVASILAGPPPTMPFGATLV